MEHLIQALYHVRIDFNQERAQQFLAIQTEHRLTVPEKRIPQLSRALRFVCILKPSSDLQKIFKQSLIAREILCIRCLPLSHVLIGTLLKLKCAL